MDKLGPGLDAFANMMGQFIRETPLKVWIDIPEGSSTPEIGTNIECSPIMQFYILMHTIGTVYRDFCHNVRTDEDNATMAMNAMLDLVRAELEEVRDELYHAEMAEEETT